jgi:hypothetical protein
MSPRFPAGSLFIWSVICSFIFAGVVVAVEQPLPSKSGNGLKPKLPGIFSGLKKGGGCCSGELRSEPSGLFDPLAAFQYETYGIAATYYSLNGGVATTLMLNNKGPQPILALPTFYSLSGTRLQLAPITVPGASYIDVDMHVLLAGAAPEFREGSLKIAYQGGDYQLGAQVRMVELPSPFRIGINGGGNDRKQSLKATVSPTSVTANTNIQVSSKITLTNVQKNTSTGVITFDVVGNSASAAGSSCSGGDSFITAEFSNGTLFATLLEKPAFVAVPSKVATPHDTTGSLVIANRVLDASTSPAVPGLPANHVLLATIFVRFLTITVQDQCNNLIGDLYAGARVTETHETAMVDINQPLTASSTYSDPAGVMNDQGGAVVPRDDPAATGWPTWPLLPMPALDVTQNVAVQVDGFALAPAIVGRRVVASPSANTVTITWPN